MSSTPGAGRASSAGVSPASASSGNQDGVPRSVEPEWISLREAARIYAVSTYTLRRRIATGHLPAVKLGYKLIRVRISDLDKLFKAWGIGFDVKTAVADPQNAIRTARNEAAHAAVAADGAQAALLFNEAIEALEEGYAGTAFKENELAQYYREAEDYLNRCSEGKPLKARQSSPQNAQHGKAAARTKPRNPQTVRSTKSTAGRQNTSARSRSTGTKQSRGTASRSKKQQTGGESRVALGIILAALVLGLIARAISMGLV